MTHRLWPDFRAAGKNSVGGCKADTRTVADVVYKFRPYGNFITVFKRRHSVILKAAIADGEADGGGSFFTRSLVSYAGVINVLEAAIFNEDVFGGKPKFNGIAKANFKLVAPNAATDIFKMAVSDGDVFAARPRNGVNGAVTEAKPVEDYVIADKAKVGASEVDCLNFFINGCGVADRVEIEMVLRGRALAPFFAKIVLHVQGVEEVALCRKVLDIIAKRGYAKVTVKDDISDTAAGFGGTEPDVFALGGNPILGAAYVGSARKGGCIPLPVCAVGNRGIGRSRGKREDTVGSAALKQYGVPSQERKRRAVADGRVGRDAVVM